MIEVLRAGLCDLVMDQGRPGQGALGVPMGGAADPAALAAANRLVGNPPESAGLEIVLAGPELHFPDGGTVAFTGAKFAARRSNGEPVRWNETLHLSAGERLTLGAAESGSRCWLAVSGGLAVPPVLGSRSTFLPAGFGGLEGRALRAGDRLARGEHNRAPRPLCAQPPAWPEAALRVVAGPQTDWFDDAGLAAFFGTTYRVGQASDRRGIRLEGVSVARRAGELPSQGVLPGAIQVPPDGQPIILGWDGPVTGGYPVVATVVSADWARLAQLRPGDPVCFVTVAVDEARGLVAGAWQIEDCR